MLSAAMLVATSSCVLPPEISHCPTPSRLYFTTTRLSLLFGRLAGMLPKGVVILPLTVPNAYAPLLDTAIPTGASSFVPPSFVHQRKRPADE